MKSIEEVGAAQGWVSITGMSRNVNEVGELID